jgi:hypothetical protein
MQTVDIKRKLTSRRFWICMAAFLGSIASSIAGLQSGKEWVTIIGVVCGTLSAAIYAATEASVDKARIEHDEGY